MLPPDAIATVTRPLSTSPSRKAAAAVAPPGSAKVFVRNRIVLTDSAMASSLTSRMSSRYFFR